jgi:hypothetical protein
MKSFKYLVFIIIVLLIISVVACTIPEQVNNDDPFDKVEKDQNETTNSPQKTTAGNNENKNERKTVKTIIKNLQIQTIKVIYLKTRVR